MFSCFKSCGLDATPAVCCCCAAVAVLWKDAKTTEFPIGIYDDVSQLDVEIVCLQQRRNEYFGQSHTERVKAERWCGNCGKKGGESLSTCSRCKSAFYCSKDCQKTHWKVHKLRCKAPVSLVEDDAPYSIITEMIKYGKKILEEERVAEDEDEA